MTNSNLTHIVAILDRSGSMVNKVEDTEGGFESFIKEQRKTPGEKLVTLVQFDHEYEMIYQGVDIKKVPRLRLVPRGSTALHDAVGKTIAATGQHLRALPKEERPGSIVFVIMTDGYENCSQEFTADKVKRMIKHQQDKYSWLFKFFGADVTALQVAQEMGIGHNDALFYASQNSGIAFRNASASTTRYIGATASGLGYVQASSIAAFTDDERDQAANAPSK